MKKDISVTLKPLKMKILPYAFARMSDDFFTSSKGSKPKRFPLIIFYQLCMSIELGLKSVLFTIDQYKFNRDYLKRKSHNLDNLMKDILESGNLINLNGEDQESVRKINVYFIDKSLEYFTASVIRESIKGFKNFPKLEDLEKTALKINKYLKKSNFFIGFN